MDMHAAEFPQTPIASVLRGSPAASMIWASGTQLGKRSTTIDSFVPTVSYMRDSYMQRELPRAKVWSSTRGGTPWVGPVVVGRQYSPEYSPLKVSLRIGHHSGCCGSAGLVHPAVAVSGTISSTEARYLTAPLGFKRSATLVGLDGHSHSALQTMSLTAAAELLKPVPATETVQAATDHYHVGKRLLASVKQLAAAERTAQHYASTEEAVAQRYWLTSVLSKRAETTGFHRRPRGKSLDSSRRYERSAVCGETVSSGRPTGAILSAGNPACVQRGEAIGFEQFVSLREYPGAPTCRREPLNSFGNIRGPGNFNGARNAY